MVMADQQFVGLSEIRFNVGLPGTEQEWSVNQSGDWNQSSNWDHALVPNGQDQTAVFGAAITSDRIVFTETPITVNRIEFANASSSYFIAGARSINLMANTEPTPVDPTLSAMGTHEFQAPVSLHNDTTVDVASGSVLTFNNALNLNGRVLTKTGIGNLAVNNILNTGGGTLNLQQGTVSGGGAVGGDVNNGGGTISPGNSLVPGSSAAVPEPATIALLLLGLFFLGAAVRRRLT